MPRAEYYAKNKERLKLYNKLWRDSHQSYWPNWRKLNPNWKAEYYEKNRDRILANARQYNLDHPDMQKLANATYYRKNRAKILENARLKRLEKKNGN